MYQMTILADFLLRENVQLGGTLPVVHTMPARLLRQLSQSNVVAPQPCDVFVGETLSYFFVGRPAYKYRSDEREAEYWELPCCFIFEFEALKSVRRVFPFDTGAFHNKLYPPYINNMPMNDFEVSSVMDSTSRIIGAFFGDPRSYFDLKPKDEGNFEQEFPMQVFDQEIKALHRLARERAPVTFDDRRFSIEIQETAAIDLRATSPLAVIAPFQYYNYVPFRNQVETTWRAVPLGYPTYPLSVAAYYYAVYERVEEFFRLRGLI